LAPTADILLRCREPPLHNPAKAVVDLFRYRQRAAKRCLKSPGLNLALEGLREALRLARRPHRHRARWATEGGIWKVVQPYLDAMTANA
jgi:hypothetical protein